MFFDVRIGHLGCKNGVQISFGITLIFVLKLLERSKKIRYGLL